MAKTRINRNKNANPLFTIDNQLIKSNPLCYYLLLLEFIKNNIATAINPNIYRYGHSFSSSIIKSTYYPVLTPAITNYPHNSSTCPIPFTNYLYIYHNVNHFSRFLIYFIKLQLGIVSSFMVKFKYLLLFIIIQQIYLSKLSYNK